MRTSKRMAAFLLVAAMGTTSCGTSEKKVSAPTPGASEAAVKEGGVFRAASGEPVAIDPYNVADTAGNRIAKRLFVGLTTFDRNPDLVMRPGVAERWTADAECTQWTFNLRRSTFSNGEDLTADSFIRGWTRAADGRAASRVAAHLSGIQGYEALHGSGTAPPTATTFAGLSAPDPQTLVIKLNAPDCEFDKKTLHPVFSPVPTVAGSFDNKTYNEAPVGNGAFMIKPGTKWEHDNGISLVPNPLYYGAKPHIDAVELVIFPAQAPAGVSFQAFEAGELDIAMVPVGQQKEVEASYGPKGWFMKEVPYSLTYLQPNLIRGPLRDPDARRAVSLAIDRTAISQAVGGGFWEPAAALLPPPFGTYYQPGVCDVCRFDPARAKELAARSGLTPGTHLKLLVASATSPVNLAYKDQLEKNLGLVVDVEAAPRGQILARLDSGDFDLAPTGWFADYPTPDNFLYPLLGRGSGENIGRYDSAEFNLLIQRARAQRNDADRKRTYQEAERLAIARDVALIPTFYQPNLRVLNADKWTGVEVDFFGFLALEKISLK